MVYQISHMETQYIGTAAFAWTIRTGLLRLLRPKRPSVLWRRLQPRVSLVLPSLGHATRRIISFSTRRGSNASRLSVTYAHVEEHRRTRSTSTSTIGPHSSPLAQRQRTGRSRAPTLAGEALEHAQLGVHAHQCLMKCIQSVIIIALWRMARAQRTVMSRHRGAVPAFILSQSSLSQILFTRPCRL